MQNDIYTPIVSQLNAWVDYEERMPREDYRSNPERRDTFRSENDLDCVLRGGNLHADTIFSLWLPLRFTLVNLHSHPKIRSVVGLSLAKSSPFLKALAQADVLQELLPAQSETTQLLSRLFELGQRVENTMLLPERWMNPRRGDKPYYDYMPYFLYECFAGGAFRRAFQSDDDLKEWIVREDLVHFFTGEVGRNNIKDLAGTGSVKRGVPDDLDHLNQMLRAYIDILEKRQRN